MNPDRKNPSGRYRVAGNVEAQYVDADETVLVNRLGICDARLLEVREEEALIQAYGRLLGEVREDSPMTSELLLHIHGSIFSGIYEWGGRWRTVTISKPGVIWPPPDFLDQAMADFERSVLQRHPASELFEDERFCAAVGEIQGEFLAIHPFREGNARTIKLMTDLLAAQTGRRLLKYDDSPQGVDAYIAAAIAAIGKDYGPMALVIRAALARSVQRL